MVDIIVTTQHMRRAQLCVAGSRPWFARHGLDWKDFILNGIPASRLRALDDGMANKAVAIAEADARENAP